MSRGVWRIFAVALTTYQQTLETHALLDFSGVLERAIHLLKQMDEFARSRYRLEARYHHVLVDEFQDTSRAQWELVAQLVRSWGEGLGASADALPPSIFVVGDRKQSIYGFRDAEVAILEDAAGFIEALRPDGIPDRPSRSASVPFPQLLHFVNDVFDDVALPAGELAVLRKPWPSSGKSTYSTGTPRASGFLPPARPRPPARSCRSCRGGRWSALDPVDLVDRRQAAQHVGLGVRIAVLDRRDRGHPGLGCA